MALSSVSLRGSCLALVQFKQQQKAQAAENVKQAQAAFAGAFALCAVRSPPLK